MRRLMIGLVLVALSGGPAHAQRSGPGWDRCGQLFDDKTVETLSGAITSVDKIARGNGMQGVRITVKTAKETLVVHLGPERHIVARGFSFKTGDNVTVNGSRVQFEGSPILIATDLTLRGKKLVLRDKDGYPRWAGGRRRGGS